MSMFDRLDRLTSHAVDRTFAIRFEVQPGKATPNGRYGPDPDRQAWDGKGVLEEIPIYPAVEMGSRNRTGNDLETLVAGVAIEMSVDRIRYSRADEAKQGDRLKTDDLRKFEIARVRRDGLSRVVFNLVELTARPISCARPCSKIDFRKSL